MTIFSPREIEGSTIFVYGVNGTIVDIDKDVGVSVDIHALTVALILTKNVDALTRFRVDALVSHA